MSRAYKILVLRILPLLLVAVAGGFALLRAQGNQLLSVQTGSMVPNIRRGYLVAVNDVPLSQLKVGDVVTYKSTQESLKGATITHRIQELPSPENGQKFITKGDANPSADVPFSGDRIVGRVDRAVPYAGFALDFLSTPLGLLLVIYLPALFIIIDEIKRLAKHYEGQKPWRDLTHRRFRVSGSRNTRNTTNVSIVLSIAIIGIFMLRSGLTYARLQDTAQLTGNSIKAKRAVTPPTPPTTCQNGNSSTTNVTVNGNSGSTSNSNININSSTTQSSTSGNATSSNNTNGGSATSGNVSNCNSTTINIQIR